MKQIEKAKELFGKYYFGTVRLHNYTTAKECAKIAVDQILEALQVTPIENRGHKLYDSQIDFWELVKEEIEKL